MAGRDPQKDEKGDEYDSELDPGKTGAGTGGK